MSDDSPVLQAIREWHTSPDPTRLAQLLPVAPAADVGVPELLAQYDRDQPDDREPTASTPCDELAARPDFDVPYLRLADLLRERGETALALGLVQYAVPRCRRRTLLLARAGDYLLFAGKARESARAYAQSIAVMASAPRTGDVEQRAFVGLGVLLDVFEEPSEWLPFREGEREFAHEVREAAGRVSPAERESVAAELPLLSRGVRESFPREVNPPLGQAHEPIAARVAELASSYRTLPDSQRMQWYDRHYLDHLVDSGEEPEDFPRAAVELRRIGFGLHNDGGVDLMTTVSHRAGVLANTNIRREVAVCWDGIGEWTTEPTATS